MSSRPRLEIGIVVLVMMLLGVIGLMVSHPARAMQLLQATATTTTTPAGTITATPAGTTTATPNPLAAYPVVSVNVVRTARVRGGYAFSPKTLTVTAGSMVVWNNASTKANTITSRTRGWKFDKTLRPHGTVRAIFTKVGTYRYYSRVHHSMTGKVVVR